MMRLGPMVRGIPLSFFSREFYREVAVSWRGEPYLYILIVLAVCWFPFALRVHRSWVDFMTTEAEALLFQIPAISIQDGRVSIDAEQPHRIRDQKRDRLLAILDTTGQITSLEGTEALILLTRSRLIARKGERETRIYELSGVRSFSIDRERVRGWLKIAAVWAPPALYVLMLALSYCYRLLQALLFGAVGLLARRGSAPELNYAIAVRLAIVALTPAILLKSVLEAAEITFPWREAALWALALTYLFYALAVPAGPTSGSASSEYTPRGATGGESGGIAG